MTACACSNNWQLHVDACLHRALRKSAFCSSLVRERRGLHKTPCDMSIPYPPLSKQLSSCIDFANGTCNFFYQQTSSNFAAVKEIVSGCRSSVAEYWQLKLVSISDGCR